MELGVEMDIELAPYRTIVPKFASTGVYKVRHLIAHTILLMILQLPQMPISSVAMNYQRPVRDTGEERSRVFGKWV
jgi:hypothetical protein